MQYEDHAGTDFYKDIWPVLSGTYKLSWVNEKAFQGHGKPNDALRPDNVLIHGLTYRSRWLR